MEQENKFPYRTVLKLIATANIIYNKTLDEDLKVAIDYFNKHENLNTSQTISLIELMNQFLLQDQQIKIKAVETNTLNTQKLWNNLMKS